MSKEMWRTEPVKIKTIKVKGKHVRLNQKFSEGNDWLKGLTVSLENTSQQPIVYIKVEILFRRPKGVKNSEQTPSYLYPLFFGEMPAPGASSQTGAGKRLLPGESVDFVLPEDEHLHIKTALESLGFPAEITKATIAIGAVVFADGTMWSADAILRPDPNNPEKWDVIKDLSKPAPVSNNRQDELPRSGLSFIAANFRLKKTLNGRTTPFTSLALLQDATQPCTSIYEGKTTISCPTSGCTRRQDNWYDLPDLIGLRNRAKESFFENCFMSTGSRCYADFGGPNSRPALCGLEVTEVDLCREMEQECFTGGGTWKGCTRGCYSPIVIAVEGNGFNLTGANAGVNFDIDGDGLADNVSWTNGGADDAWLFLDRNGNGAVDNGEELFGPR